MPLSTVLGAQSLIKPGVCTTATRPASPYTGQMIYDTTVSQTLVWNGTAWIGTGRIAQVVSTNLTSTFSTAATSYTDITGLSVSITPTTSTSKVLVWVNFSASVSADISVMFRLMRDSTAINIGDTAGSRTRASAAMMADNTVLQYGTFGWNYLDSPATTSSTTYKVQMFVNSGTGYIGRTGQDTDAANRPRTASNITVMEVFA